MAMPDSEMLAAIRREVDALQTRGAAAEFAVRWRLPLVILAVLVGVYLLGAFLNNNADLRELWTSTLHVYLYVIAAIAAAAGIWWALGPKRRAGPASRQELFAAAFRFIDHFRYSKGRAPESFNRLPRELVGAFDRQTFDDVISGRYNGFDFELFEARLTQQDEPVFVGTGLVFAAEHSFPGVLIAGQQTPKTAGFLRGIFGAARLEPVESGQPDLDEGYVFLTDNPEAARRLVAGPLAKALQWLGESWPEGRALVALKGADAFVLLPSQKNLFELPEPAAGVDFDRDLKPAISDLVVLLETAALMGKVGAPG